MRDSMKHRSRSWRVLIAVLWSAAAPAGEPALGEVANRLEDPALQACLARSLPARTMTQQLSIKVFDATGSVTESAASLYWKRAEDDRSRFLIRLSDPPMRAGVAILAIEQDRDEPDLYLYLPELRQTRRVTGRTFSGSMLGTDFTYEDYVQFHGITMGGKSTRLADAVVDGQAVYVVALTPGTDVSAYSKIVSYIDEARCLPLRTEFYGHDGSLAKELTIDQATIQQLAERYIPRHLIMIDHLQSGRTELLVTKVVLDEDISDKLFAPSSLASER